MPVELQPTGMPPEQAMQILQQLGITQDMLPIVMQAIQAVIGAQGQPQGDPRMVIAKQLAAGPGGGLLAARQQY